MKIISVILSLLVLTSSFLASGDEFLMDTNTVVFESNIIEGTTIHGDHHKDTREHKEHHADESHSEEDGCKDDCHFCICTCTAHNMLPLDFQITDINLETIQSKINIEYSFLYSNEYLSTIFQPPQV